MERINCFPSKDGTFVALYVGDLPYPICEREQHMTMSCIPGQQAPSSGICTYHIFIYVEFYIYIYLYMLYIYIYIYMYT